MVSIIQAEALDVEQFNTDLLQPLQGEIQPMPKFDFSDGKRHFTTARHFGYTAYVLLIVEGIYALNWVLMPRILGRLNLRYTCRRLTSISLDGSIVRRQTIVCFAAWYARALEAYSAVETTCCWQSRVVVRKRTYFLLQDRRDV